MLREKLIKKIAKAVAKSDNAYNGDPDSTKWPAEDQGLYLQGADAALKELARIIRKTPLVEWGDHDITDEFVDFFAGDLDEFAPLDER